MVREKQIHGARVYYNTRNAIIGLTELPAHFVAANDARLLIVGQPDKDTIQAALASLGMLRAEVERIPMGQGTIGLLVDLVA